MKKLDIRRTEEGMTWTVGYLSHVFPGREKWEAIADFSCYEEAVLDLQRREAPAVEEVDRTTRWIEVAMQGRDYSRRLEGTIERAISELTYCLRGLQDDLARLRRERDGMFEEVDK